MKLIEGKKYILVFDLNNNTLSFTAEIIEDDNDFIRFKDKFGEELTYSKKYLVSLKEIKND